MANETHDFVELRQLKHDIEDQFLEAFRATPCSTRHSMQHLAGVVSVCSHEDYDLDECPILLCLPEYCPKLK